MRVGIATRSSALALWQAEHVAAQLRAAEPDADVRLVRLETMPDRRLDLPLWELGGKGLFVKEIQAAVLDGRADVAVHSAKDLPARTPDALTLVAVPERGDARDALVGSTLGALRPGGVVATGSARRRAQLAHLRPDLTFRGLRGNIATRMSRLDDGDVDAVVVAVAALERLGETDRAAEVLAPVDVLPQVGQGALAIECRADDAAAVAAGQDPALDARRRALVRGLDHPVSRREVDAERSFLEALGGDCDLPAGCHAVTEPDGTLTVEGLITSLDGHVVLRERRGGDDGVALGHGIAVALLDAGGRALLAR